jgi:NADP-dependent 3-hydroxy acid dehydrogenase YdfG
LAGNDAFWDFTDAAYEQNIAQNMSELDTLVANAGVDTAAFNACLDNGDFTQK